MATPTQTASPSASANSDAESAIARVSAYVQLLDRLSSEPDRSLDQLSTVARGSAADQWRQIIARYRLAGQRQYGTSSLSLINVLPGSSARQWRVISCLDVSDVDVRNKNGKSVIDKDGPDHVRDVFTVDQDARSSQWYVTRDEVKGTC